MLQCQVLEHLFHFNIYKERGKPFEDLRPKTFEDLSNWQRIKELSTCGQNRKREEI